MGRRVGRERRLKTGLPTPVQGPATFAVCPSVENLLRRQAEANREYLLPCLRWVSGLASLEERELQKGPQGPW